MSDLNFIFETCVLGDCNRGWHMDQVIIMRDNNCIGQLNINYMTSESYNEWNPTIFNHLAHYGGWCGFPFSGVFQLMEDREMESKQHYKQMSNDRRRELRDSIAWHEYSIDYSKRSTLQDTDADVSLTILNFEETLNREYESDIKFFKQTQVDDAVLDHIVVEHELELDVFVEAALAAANWFNTRGMTLHFSNTISFELTRLRDELIYRNLTYRGKRDKTTIITS